MSDLPYAVDNCHLAQPARATALENSTTNVQGVVPGREEGSTQTELLLALLPQL